MLEVVEADFSKNLAEVRATEDASQDEFVKLIKENQIAKAGKDVEEKTKVAESKALDKAASEVENDRQGSQQQLDAVNEYFEKLKPQCITAPVSYEERKKRREETLAGLKEGLEILGESEN